MYLPFSPAGREITDLYGDPAVIRRRGSEIISMGSRMISGADFLKSLAEQSDGQKGKAVEKLREVVGDTHHELRRAGTMYKPTGGVLKTYADALADCKPRVRQAVEECEIRWQSYQAAPGYTSGERPWWAKEEDGSPEAETAAQQDRTKQLKYDSYLAQAQTFDREMDTWESAFNEAADSIGTILEGGIRDSFWDNVDGFVAGALEVLKWAGIILAIAAIVIGGPIIALLAAVVSALTLALTIYQFIRDDTGLTELILAVVGVIPFGSMGKLFQAGKRLDFLGDMFKVAKPSTWTKAFTEGRSIAGLFRAGGGGFSGAWNAFSKTWMTNNPAGVGDVMMRLMFGKDVKSFTEIADNMANGATSLIKNAAAWEFMYTLGSGSWKLVDNIATWTGNGDSKPSKQFPIVGALL